MNQLPISQKTHNLVVEETAEDIKIKIGSAFPDDDFDKTTLEVEVASFIWST